MSYDDDYDSDKSSVSSESHDDNGSDSEQEIENYEKDVISDEIIFKRNEIVRSENADELEEELGEKIFENEIIKDEDNLSDVD